MENGHQLRLSRCAIGLNARYVIGIWTGRPDGTPVAGQFGFASAVPLLNQVNNLLQSRSTIDEARLPRDPRPESVGRGVICWPAGNLCRRAVKTAVDACRRLLEGSEPPTLLLPEQEGIRGIHFPIWLDKTGKRVAADCPDATESAGRLAATPGAVAACSRKRAARLPAPSTVCPPLDDNNAAPLMISGVREGRSLSVFRVRIM